MLERRLQTRENPFPEGRAGTLDDLVFLPANLSRLVIDPYREACRVDLELADKMSLERPFFVTGFDDAPEEVRTAVAAGLKEGNSGLLGRRPIGAEVPWLQLVTADDTPDAEAAALLQAFDTNDKAPSRVNESQLLGFAVSRPEDLEQAIPQALEAGHDVMLLDGSGGLAKTEGGAWPELTGNPDLRMIRDAIAILRRLGREEEIDLIYFGGLRSGTDAAKVIAMGCVAQVFGVAVGLAAGGEITDEGLAFASNYSEEDRRLAVVNLLKAHAGEASMMARCTGKTNLQNLEPEDLRTISLATAEATGIVLVGKH